MIPAAQPTRLPRRVNRMRTSKTASGFGLLELLIAVAIVGILATIAYPSYVSQVEKSRRTEAKSLLLRAANRQERFYSTTSPNSYAANMTALGYDANAVPSGETGNAANAWYLVSVMTPANAAAVIGTACPATNCFVLEAVPQRGQTGDTRCATLRLDSFGRRYTTGTQTVDECW